MSSRLCSHTYVSFSLQENHVIHVLSLMIMFYTYFRRPKILTSLHAICLPRLAKIFRNPRQAYQHQPAISLRATAPLDCLQVCLQKFNKMKKNDASVTSRKQNKWQPEFIKKVHVFRKNLEIIKHREVFGIAPVTDVTH